MRSDGRLAHELRPLKLTPHVSSYAEGSVLIETGGTRVLCTASVETSIPKWLQGQGQGWVSAEYGMLPRSTHTRITREKATNSGRSQEISRLIARALRAGVDLKGLGERQITVDCDVLQADGGTRTAAISGGFVALGLALQKLVRDRVLARSPLITHIAAVSCGVRQGEALLDLNYDEDSTCETDMNFVLTQDGSMIEVQGTAEKRPFTMDQLQAMTGLAQAGCKMIFEAQKKILET